MAAQFRDQTADAMGSTGRLLFIRGSGSVDFSLKVTIVAEAIECELAGEQRFKYGAIFWCHWVEGGDMLTCFALRPAEAIKDFGRLTLKRSVSQGIDQSRVGAK